MTNGSGSWVERLVIAAGAVLLVAWMLREAAALLLQALPVLGAGIGVVGIGAAGYVAWRHRSGTW